MRALAIEWIRFLEGHESLLGAILFVAGLCYLFVGWRFVQTSLISIYGLTGAALGSRIGEADLERTLYAVFCGAGLAALGWVLRQYAGPMLAAALAAATVAALMGPSSVPSPTYYIVLGVVFIAIVAVGMTSRRETTIILTSFVGAIVLVSGLVAMVAESRTLVAHYRGMSSNGFFFPFLLMVATTCGILLQLGAAKRSDSGDIAT